MQYSWLENMTKQGSVRKEARDLIYRDCALVLDKLAAPKPPVKASDLKLQELKSVGKSFVNRVGDYAVMGGIVALGKSILDRLQDSSTVKTIINNRASIMALPEVDLHKEKAGARFDELVRLAPQVAAMPELSKRVVINTLHSGFTDSDVVRLSSLQAQYSSDRKEPEKIHGAFEKRLTKSAEMIGETTADIVKIIKEAAPKKSGWGAVKPVLHSIAALTGAHLLLGAGVGAANAIRSAVGKKELELELRKSFETAMSESDPSREALHANKDKAYKAFQTLAHFAPTVATNPSAARSFMNSMMSYDLGTPLGSIKDLSDIEKNLKGTRGSGAFMEGFGATLKETGAGRAFGGAVEHSLRSVAEDDMEAISSHLYGKNPTHPNFK